MPGPEASTEKKFHGFNFALHHPYIYAVAFIMEIQFTIRTALQADLPGILTIYNDAILNTTSVYDYKPHTIEMREKWFNDKRNANLPVLVAEAGGSIAGFASYGPFRSWAAYKYSVEHSVYVHENFRRKGIARALMKELIRMAAKKEIHTMIAGIDAENTVSIALHQQLGFVQTAHMKAVGYKFGKWLDLVFMQLMLPGSFNPVEE